MNKKKVDEMLPKAYKILYDLGIMGGDGEKNKKWRSQISSFGAAIAQGSLLAAVSFFSAQGRAETQRELLMAAIWLLINEDELNNFLNPKTTDEEKARYKEDTTRLFGQVSKNPTNRQLKKNIMHAAVALKLAMNLYDLGKEENEDARSS